MTEQSLPEGVERYTTRYGKAGTRASNGEWIKYSDLPAIIEQARQEECESCNDTGVYYEGDEWTPCQECGRGQRFLGHLKTAVAEARQEERERLREARRDTDGVPFLDAARALCPDSAHWEDGGWERYAADASACLDAFLDALDQQQEGSGDA